MVENSINLTPFKTITLELYSALTSMEQPSIDSFKTSIGETLWILVLSRPSTHSMFWTPFRTTNGLFTIVCEIDFFQDHSEEKIYNSVGKVTFIWTHFGTICEKPKRHRTKKTRTVHLSSSFAL